MKILTIAYIALCAVLIAICAGGCAPCYASYTKYRLDHCEVKGCAKLDLEAHHILPQSRYPEYADGQGGTNIITLCRFHHVQWGHCGDTTRYYNIKVRKMVDEYNTGMRKYED